MREHSLDCDVLVAGGGPAGVPCALSAARCGASVVLVQDRPVLGGNASSEVRMHIVGADASGYRGEALRTEAREGGIIEEVRLECCVQNPQRSASMLDLIFYDLCRQEPNLAVMLNTSLTGVAVENGRIASAVAERQSTEERIRIRADVFVDCTGDGRLGVEAGAPCVHGRESRDTYGEPWAAEEADGKTLGSTLLFQGRDMGRPVPFTPPPWARKISEEDLALRPHARRGVDSGLEYGYWWLEWGGQLDTIKDNEAIRDELLAILMGVWDHIKNGGDHGAENWALDWFGFLPGKRESRRFIGQHVLTQHDLVESRPFDDAIAFGGWPIDTHPPEGVDAPEEPPCDQRYLEHLYDIPLRACVSRDVPNLMFAGRNLSASHIAFASTRVMATCAAVGQGVGTAAAHAAAQAMTPAQLAEDGHAMAAIQQRLLRDDAYLVGRSNEDPADLARIAAVSASSQQPQGKADSIISGATRAAAGPRGAPPGRAPDGTQRWMSDSAEGLPAWIELRWDQPKRIAEIQIIFDTGMHRVLTLSHSDAYVDRMQWGRPQPETVRDFAVHGEAGGTLRELARVEGNYQRRRVVRFEPQPLDAVRLEITATNGVDHARVLEIRAYDESGS